MTIKYVPNVLGKKVLGKYPLVINLDIEFFNETRDFHTYLVHWAQLPRGM